MELQKFFQDFRRSNRGGRDGKSLRTRMAVGIFVIKPLIYAGWRLIKINRLRKILGNIGAINIIITLIILVYKY